MRTPTVTHIISGQAMPIANSKTSRSSDSLCRCKNSTSTRIVYAVLLFVGVWLAATFLIPELQPALAKIDGLCIKETRFDEDRQEVKGEYDT